MSGTTARMDMAQALNPRAVMVRASAVDRNDAVRRAGNLLVEAGLATPEYVDAMVATMENSGPYFVIAPGLAVPHARPEDGAVSAGLGVLVLDRPVSFGSAANDPVDILIPFTSGSSDAHVKLLSSLATFLSEPGILGRMREAESADDVRRLFYCGRVPA